MRRTVFLILVLVYQTTASAQLCRVVVHCSSCSLLGSCRVVNSIGTGTPIYSQGEKVYILTVGHLFNRCNQVTVQFHPGEPEWPAVLLFALYQPPADMAVLMADIPETKQPTKVYAIGNDPRPGTVAMLAGFPHGNWYQRQVTVRGIDQAYVTFFPRPHQGESGAPLLVNFYVSGLVVGYIDQQTGLAIRPSLIKYWLRERHVPFHETGMSFDDGSLSRSIKFNRPLVRQKQQEAPTPPVVKKDKQEEKFVTEKRQNESVTEEKKKSNEEERTTPQQPPPMVPSQQSPSPTEPLVRPHHHIGGGLLLATGQVLLTLLPWVLGIGATGGTGALIWFAARSIYRAVTIGEKVVHVVQHKDQEPVVMENPPPPQKVVTETRFVPYEKDECSEELAWAQEQLVRKYPGAATTMQVLNDLIRQYRASKG